ncbi:uncharacterized protein LOC144175222 [Haemaphysalis longicornis]
MVVALGPKFGIQFQVAKTIIIGHKIGHTVGHKVSHKVGHKFGHKFGHKVGHNVGHKVTHKVGLRIKCTGHAVVSCHPKEGLAEHGFLCGIMTREVARVNNLPTVVVVEIVTDFLPALVVATYAMGSWAAASAPFFFGWLE